LNRSSPRRKGERRGRKKGGLVFCIVRKKKMGKRDAYMNQDAEKGCGLREEGGGRGNLPFSKREKWRWEALRFSDPEAYIQSIRRRRKGALVCGKRGKNIAFITVDREGGIKREKKGNIFSVSFTKSERALPTHPCLSTYA